ncbi:MAG: Eco57I restriction-modification methylase domain-containing protein [Pyrinomonadaceae bacterium]
MEGFDAIIGNPPYSYMIDEASQKYFDRNYHHQDYQRDLYLLFIERYPYVLKDKGKLGIIVSNTWLQSITLRKIRSYIANTYEWRRLLYLPTRVFNAIVDTHVLIFRVRKSDYEPNETFDVDVRRSDRIQLLHSLPKAKIPRDGSPINIVDSLERQELFRRLRDSNSTLSKVAEIYNGVKPFEKGKGTPPQTAEILKSKPFVAEGDRPGREWSPLLRGALIQRYCNLWNRDYWILYGPWLAAQRDPAIFAAPEKIMVRQTGDSIIATIVGSGYVARNNLHIVLPKENGLKLTFLLGVLNSKLTDFYYSILNPEKGEALAEVKKEHISQLPISEISENNADQNAMHDLIVRSVEHIMEAKQKLAAAASERDRDFWQNKCDVLEKTIDDAVYKLYGLTDSEIRLVER